jgi:hypothetical protein
MLGRIKQLEIRVARLEDSEESRFFNNPQRSSLRNLSETGSPSSSAKEIKNRNPDAYKAFSSLYRFVVQTSEEGLDLPKSYSEIEKAQKIKKKAVRNALRHD